MLMNVTLTLPGRPPEVVPVNAVILLAQDQNETYVVMHGPLNVLQTLLIWGAEHWFLLPPGPEYFQAVNDILVPAVAKNDDRWIDTVIATDHSDHASRRGMSFELTGARNRTCLAGLTDLLLFVLDGSTPKSADGGSGMQKGALLEKGIAYLFGEKTAEAFIEAKYAGIPSGVRNLVEGMRRRMREEPGEALVITPAAMDAMIGKGDKEKN